MQDMRERKFSHIINLPEMLNQIEVEAIN